MLPFEKHPDAVRVIPALDFSELSGKMPPINLSKNAIDTLDFTMLGHKLCLPEPNISRLWSPETVEQAIVLYKNWLWIIRKYGDQYPVLPPSIEIDEIWHHHILDTYKYHEDCLAIFGQYYHHYPYFGMRGSQDYENLQDAFEDTQKLYFSEFGEYICSFEESLEELESDVLL